MADRRVESGLHRAGLHGARVRRVRDVRRGHLAGADGPCRLGARRGAPVDGGPRRARRTARRAVRRRPARDQLPLRDVESRGADGIDHECPDCRRLGGLCLGVAPPRLGFRCWRRHGARLVHEGLRGLLRGGARRRRADHAPREPPPRAPDPPRLCRPDRRRPARRVVDARRTDGGSGRSRRDVRGAPLDRIPLLQLADDGHPQAELRPAKPARPRVLAAGGPGLLLADVARPRGGGRQRRGHRRALAARPN
jgi:hypothetical protein